MLIYLNNGYSNLKKKNKINFTFFNHIKSNSKKIKLLNQLMNELVNQINLNIIKKNKILIKKLIINLFNTQLIANSYKNLNLKKELLNIYYFSNKYLIVDNNYYKIFLKNFLEKELVITKYKKEKNLLILLYLLIYLNRCSIRVKSFYLVKTKKKLMTLLRGPHIDKKGREQFVLTKSKGGFEYSNYLEKKWTKLSIGLLSYVEGILLRENVIENVE